jgi:nitroreductase
LSSSASEFLKVLTTRRSVRNFQEKSIEKDQIQQLIEAARWAPSAGNCQPLEIIVAQDLRVKQALAEGALGQNFIAKASVVFVLCANLPRTTNRYRERGSRMYVYNDIGAATQNLLLMAHVLGLGAVWVGSFDDTRIAETLGLPRHVIPISIVPVGFPAGDPGERLSSRRQTVEFVHPERW